MQQKSFLGHSPSGFHTIAYTEWGDMTARPPVVCVHGLTRNGRDFDPLAQVLQAQTKIFCPDIVGRGKSDWLKDPLSYAYPQYLNDMTALIARSGATSIDWVGTSMGGIIGMLLAAAPNTPIRRLVINDVGPFIELAALQRIAIYVGMTPTFLNLGEVERHVRKIYAPFGTLSDENWHHLAVNSTRLLPDGKLALAHDPAIAKNFQLLTEDVSFWDIYDRIQCPVLLLRGMMSDILASDTATEMTKRGPKAKLIEFPHVGHAPALIDITQIALIAGFLAG